jgi:hypothetical protein
MYGLTISLLKQSNKRGLILQPAVETQQHRKSMAHRPANKDLPFHRPSRQSLDPKEHRPEDAKAQANYPQFLFRLETTPIACFQ